MASLVEGYSYDVFISYRHNDNRSGWVTEFVRHLQEELAATIKEPVSVYFDTNPHDGLLETHSVDKTLEGKLKCLIFIPILSQTYCDPKSFAWQHEFVAFHKMANEDEPGRDVTLANGNIASRILPVKIHDIDAQDKATIEKELGSVLRAVDFTFRTAGVNRPLDHHEEHSNENLSKTNYKDQINKLANAIKELLQSLTNRSSATMSTAEKGPHWYEEPVKKGTRRKLAIGSLSILAIIILAIGVIFVAVPKVDLDRKSIAVLPFKNLSKDPDQEYFTQGITEDILNHLSKIADLQVKASYSSFKYDDSTKPVTEIGKELSVGSILTGSIQREGNNVRIIATLIDVETSTQIWSEKYDRQVDEVLRVQSEIAGEIARYLKAALSKEESNIINRPVAKSIDAYEDYLKARRLAQSNNEIKRPDFEAALSLLSKSIDLDPGFSDAYALKGWTWYAGRRFGFATSIWLDSSSYYAQRAVETDHHNPSGYLLKYQLNSFSADREKYGKESDLELAYAYAPNNTDVLFVVGTSYLLKNRAEGAELLVKYARLRFADYDAEYYRFWAGMFSYLRDFPRAEEFLGRLFVLSGDSASLDMPLAYLKSTQQDYRATIAWAKRAEKRIIDKGDDPVELGQPYTLIAESYEQLGEFDSALYYFNRFRAIEAAFPDTTQYIPFRHRVAYAYWLKGNKKEAMKLFNEQMHQDSSRLQGLRGIGGWGDIRSSYYDLAITHAFLGNDEAAFACFEKLRERGIQPWMFLYLRTDLMLKDFRNKPRFVEYFAKMKKDHEFRVEAVRKAVNEAEVGEQLKSRLR